MSTHDWFIEQRTAFVTRSLEPDEERSFREHLLGCADCRREIALVEQELSWLPMGAEPVVPRPGLTHALLQGALGTRQPAPRWLVPAALAASLALALGAWFWAYRTVHAFEGQLAAEQERLGHELMLARDTLGIIRQAAMVKHVAIAKGEMKGGMLIFADERTHRWNVVIYGLPASRPGETCQFWFITEEGMVRSVEVRTDGRSPALLTLGMPPGNAVVRGAALTMEPEGSSGSAPKGPELAHLEL